MANFDIRFRFLTLVIFVLALLPAAGQNGARIAATNGTADPSAILDVVATGKGVLVPRMTTAQKNSIPSPATGLLVYQTDGTTGFSFWNGSSWILLSGGSVTGSGTANYAVKWTSATDVTSSQVFDNGSVVGVGTGSPAASSLVDVSATNKGMLVPRVSLTSSSDVSTITSPATALMVYNTNASMTGGAGAGYYFFNGSRWEQLTPASKNQVTFVQWGRNTCPASSTLVYSGYAAGAHYTHSGSGANTLCLTDAPSWAGATFSLGNENGGLLYGVEYQGSGYGIATYGSLTSAQMQDYDAVCSVCLVSNASTSIMVPGTVACPSGWTQQYWGYIMSNYYTSGHTKQEYICLVNNPTQNGSNGDSNGHLWYPTETEICALAGSGYTQDREVTCSVCTK